MGTAKRARQKANRQARVQATLEAQRKNQKRNKYLRLGGGVVAFVLIALAISIFARRGDDTTVETADTTTTTATESTTTESTTTESTAAAESTSTTADASTTTTAGAPFAYGTGACPTDASPQTKTFAAAPKLCIDPAKTYVATFETTAGTVKVQLDTSRTPGTTNNFVTLARYKYYDGSLLFRTEPSIGIIQGGGKTNTDSPGYTIPDEGGKFTYSVGDLVMARTPQPNSAGAQFFFGVQPAVENLNAQGTYVSFGKVIAGLDVLVKILASNNGGAPNPAVTVNSVTIAES